MADPLVVASVVGPLIGAVAGMLCGARLGSLPLIAYATNRGVHGQSIHAYCQAALIERKLPPTRVTAPLL